MNTLPNYSAHAITDVARHEAILRRQGNVKDAAGIASFIRNVRAGVKFILPDRGSLIYDIDDVPGGVEITRLPYPITVIEVPFPTHEGMGEGMVASTKRLILAREGVWDEGTETFKPLVDKVTNPNAINVEVACFLPSENTWTVQAVGALCIIGSSSTIGMDIDDGEFAHDKFGGAAFPLITMPTQPNRAEQLWRRLGAEGFQQSVAHDVTTEIRIMAEMMAVLSCRNVGTETVSPPEKLAGVRLRSGKEPFSEVHVLMVGGGRIGGGGDAGGDDGQFKVRQHLRRGHIRNLPNGERTWVNQTVVAARSPRGQLDKVYGVKAPAS